MKREEIIKEINKRNDDLKKSGVLYIVISRECSLEDEVDCTIPVIVKLQKEEYESYNKIQEYMSREIYEHIEVIPSGSFEADLDDHFGEGSIKITF